MFEIWKKKEVIHKEEPKKVGSLFFATEKNIFEVLSIERSNGITSIKTIGSENKGISCWYKYDITDKMHEELVEKFSKDFKGFIIRGEI